jgi:outer membrane protein, multidrug efflux system
MSVDSAAPVVAGDLLDDPAWPALNARAQAQSPDVAAAAARLDAARAVVTVARSAQRPGLDAAARTSRNIDQRDGDKATVSLTLDTTYNLDLWGRLRAQARAAGLEAEAVALDRAVAEEALARALAEQLLALRLAEVQQANAARALGQAQQTDRLVTLRARAGTVAGIEPARTAAEIARLRGESVARARERDAAETAIAVIIGEAPASVRIAPANLMQVPTARMPDLPQDATAVLDRRPVVRAAALRIEAAGARSRAVRAELFPNLQLTASGGLSGASLPALTRATGPGLSLAAGLLQSLFDGGRRRATIAQTDAERRVIVAQYARELLDAAGDIERDLADIAAAQSRLAEADRQIAAQRMVASATHARLRAGSDTALDTLREDAALTTLEASRASIASDLQRARVRLSIAVGGQ